MDSDRSAQLGQGSIPGLLLRFSAPAIVGMMAQALYNLIDRIFIGHAIGSDGIAAIAVAFPFMLIVLAFGMLIGFGATAQISIRLGEQRKADAERILGNATVLLVGTSLVVTVVGLLLLGPDLEGFRRQRRRVALRPRLPANHHPGHHLPDLRVWPECHDPRRGQPAHRHALDVDQRGAQRDPRADLHLRLPLGHEGGRPGHGPFAGRLGRVGAGLLSQRRQRAPLPRPQLPPRLVDLRRHLRDRLAAVRHAACRQRLAGHLESTAPRLWRRSGHRHDGHSLRPLHADRHAHLRHQPGRSADHRLQLWGRPLRPGEESPGDLPCWPPPR